MTSAALGHRAGARPVLRQRTVVRSLPSKLYDANANVPPAPSKGMKQRTQLVYDKDKEISRTYRRSVYDFDYWANHRSTSRHWNHIASMPSSRIIRSLFPPVGFVMGVAAAVCAAHTAAQQGYIPWELPNADMTPITLTSFALSLLLVFRTNSSYGRFDEARKMWGLALNRSRDITRMAVSFFPDSDMSGGRTAAAQRKATFARWAIAWTISLKCHLRPNEDLKKEAGAVLTKDELDLLLAADHKVLMTFQMMTHIIEDAGLNNFQCMQMHGNITTFQDILGGCERLLRTPLPVSYTRHTSRFLLIWLNVLPFALYSKLGWACVPACGFIALLLLGIEEIGVEIEDPFGILALEAIAGKAKADIIETINRQDPVRNLALQERVAQEDANGALFKMQGAANEKELAGRR